MSKCPEELMKMSATAFLTYAREKNISNTWVYDFFAVQFEKFVKTEAAITEMKSRLAMLEAKTGIDAGFYQELAKMFPNGLLLRVYGGDDSKREEVTVDRNWCQG